MNREASVPDITGFFEIRFESIGGLGAHAAGQIVASAAVLRMGLNGSHFSSYGSEKKGSVVRSFVRLAAAGRAIRTSAPIETPDVVVVFHSGLLAHPATLAGIRADGLLIYSGTKGEVPEGLALLPATTRVIRVDAQTIATEERSRPNAVLIGTLTAALPFLDRQAVLDTLEATFRRAPRGGRGSQRTRIHTRRRGNRDSSRTLAAARAISLRCRPTRSGATAPRRLAECCRRPETRHTMTCTPHAPAGCRCSMTTSASTAACATWSAPIFALCGRRTRTTTESRP